MPITEVTPEEFLKKKFDSPVYTQLELEDYYDAKNGSEFDKKEFYSTPENYKSSFSKYISEADMYIPCHYWSNKADMIITNEDLKKEKTDMQIVAVEAMSYANVNKRKSFKINRNVVQC